MSPRFFSLCHLGLKKPRESHVPSQLSLHYASALVKVAQSESVQLDFSCYYICQVVTSNCTLQHCTILCFVFNTCKHLLLFTMWKCHPQLFCCHFNSGLRGGASHPVPGPWWGNCRNQGHLYSPQNTQVRCLHISRNIY